MSKLEGPLFSTDARGQICDTITYSKKCGINYAKCSTFWEPEITGLIPNYRAMFEMGVEEWQKLPQDIKNQWDTYALHFHPEGSGYNQWMRWWLFQTTNGKKPLQFPPESA